MPNGSISESPVNNPPAWVQALSYLNTIKPLAYGGVKNEGNLPIIYYDGRLGLAYAPNLTERTTFYVNDSPNDREYFKINGHYIVRQYNNIGEEKFYYWDEKDEKFYPFKPYDYPQSLQDIMKIYSPSLLVFADKIEKIYFTTTVGLLTLPVSGSAFVLYSGVSAFGITVMTEAARTELAGTEYLEIYDTISWLLIAYETGAFVGKGGQYLASKVPILEQKVERLRFLLKNNQVLSKYKTFFEDWLSKGKTILGKTKSQIGFKNGYSKESVLNKSWGQRPALNEYLETNYITEHLSKFNGKSPCWSKCSKC